MQLKLCAGCFSAQYCSKQCMRAHWGMHRQVCPAYSIGRAVKASMVGSIKGQVYAVQGQLDKLGRYVEITANAMHVLDSHDNDRDEELSKRAAEHNADFLASVAESARAMKDMAAELAKALGGADPLGAASLRIMHRQAEDLLGDCCYLGEGMKSVAEAPAEEQGTQ